MKKVKTKDKRSTQDKRRKLASISLRRLKNLLGGGDTLEWARLFHSWPCVTEVGAFQPTTPRTSAFYRWKISWSQRLSNLPKFTQYVLELGFKPGGYCKVTFLSLTRIMLTRFLEHLIINEHSVNINYLPFCPYVIPLQHLGQKYMFNIKVKRKWSGGWVELYRAGKWYKSVGLASGLSADPM